MTNVASARAAAVLAAASGALTAATAALADAERAAAVAWLDDPGNWGRRGSYARSMVQLVGSNHPDPDAAERADEGNAWLDAATWPVPRPRWDLDGKTKPTDALTEHTTTRRPPPTAHPAPAGASQ